MNFAELEQLIRRFLSAGITVVIVLIAPGTDAGDDAARTQDEPPAVTVEPDPTADEPDPTADTPDPTADEPDTGGDSILVPPGTDTPEPTELGPPRAGPPRAGAGEGRNGDAGDTAGSRGDVAGSTGDSTGGTGTGTGTTAAARFGWGTPDRVDDFDGGGEQWTIYDGPGHAGNGTRSPSAVSISNGVLTITGDSSGTTGGMAWNPGQRYGRWEGRVRVPASDPSYHALLLLWPDAGNFPAGGEIDFMEMMEPTRQQTNIFVHYSAANSTVNDTVRIDGTEWHNWAVEWTPEAITAYVDGEEWYRTTDPNVLPPGPMHLSIQLDWFPEGGQPQESSMHVDWVRQYSLDGAGTGTRTGTGTETETETGTGPGS